MNILQIIFIHYFFKKVIMFKMSHKQDSFFFFNLDLYK